GCAAAVSWWGASLPSTTSRTSPQGMRWMPAAGSARTRASGGERRTHHQAQRPRPVLLAAYRLCRSRCLLCAGCPHQGPDGESLHHEEDCIDAPSQMRGARDGAPEGPTLPAHILAAESANASRRAPTPTSSSSLPHARGQTSLARLSWLKRFPSGRLNGEKPGGARIHRYECPDLFPISCEVCPPGPRTFALGCSFRNTRPTYLGLLKSHGYVAVLTLRSQTNHVACWLLGTGGPCQRYGEPEGRTPSRSTLHAYLAGMQLNNLAHNG